MARRRHGKRAAPRFVLILRTKSDSVPGTLGRGSLTCQPLVMWVTKFAVVAVWESIFVVKDLVASIKVLSWFVLRSAAVLVAAMSCARRSESGGWLSSPVGSRRGGMAAGESRMKAPNDGTSIGTVREES
nr:hypothetical protein [Tanacetum cinerariifolium]